MGYKGGPRSIVGVSFRNDERAMDVFPLDEVDGISEVWPAWSWSMTAFIHIQSSLKGIPGFRPCCSPSQRTSIILSQLLSRKHNLPLPVAWKIYDLRTDPWDRWDALVAATLIDKLHKCYLVRHTLIFLNTHYTFLHCT